MLRVNGPLEADAGQAQTKQVVYVLRVGVSDGFNTPTISDDINIDVIPMNEAPSFTLPTLTISLPENSDKSSTIANNVLTGTDPDAGDVLTFTLSNCEDARNNEGICLFKIVPGTSSIVVNDAVGMKWNFNYEIKNKYMISITVTDSQGLMGEGLIEIVLTNVNDPPELSTADEVTSVGIQPTLGTVVAQLTGRDEDIQNSGSSEQMTLSITSGNADDAWEIKPPGGVGGTLVGFDKAFWSIRVKDPLSSNLLISGHEWNLVYTIKDTALATKTQTMKIVVQAGNARPTMVAPTPTLSISEKATIGEAVAAVSQLFVDGSQGDPIGLFITSVSPTVNPNAMQPGQLRDTVGSGVGFFSNVTRELSTLNLQGTLDYERFISLRLYIAGKDFPLRNTPPRDFISKTQEGIFDVLVSDVNESPTFGAAATTQRLRVLENTVVGGIVGDVSAHDPDRDTVLTFSLTSRTSVATDDASPFSVANVGTASSDANNNVARMKVADPTKLNYEGKNLFTMELEAKDQDDLKATVVVSVELDDAPEPPTLSDATTSVYENDGEWEYCLPFADEDGPAGNTFVLVDPSKEMERFVEIVSPGCVRGIAGRGFDYENQDLWSVVIRVTDDNNPAFTDVGTLTVVVRDVADITVSSVTPTTLLTSGGFILLNGTNMGPTASKLALMTSGEAAKRNATRVAVSFTNPTSGLTVSYQASECEILSGSNTAARCLVPPGVGSEFTWTISIGTPLYAVNRTSEFSSNFAYEAPVIANVTVGDLSTNGGAGTLSTSGGTKITITGTSLGPLGVQSSAMEVKYARGLSSADLRSNPTGIVAQECIVIVAHTKMECKASPGVGKDMEFWISNLAGSYSNVLSTHRASYFPPILSTIKLLGHDLNSLPTDGGDVVILTGSNFGPTTPTTEIFTKFQLSSVRYGPGSGARYTATGCMVTVADVEIQCSTSAGTGSLHKWTVTRGEQESLPCNTNACISSYKQPLLSSVTGQSLSSADTQGGLRITVLGQWLGNVVMNSLDPTKINIHISYGPMETPKETWYKCNDVQIVSQTNAVSCVMDPGTGAGHAMLVVVDGQTSNVLLNAISYAPPILISFSGPGSSEASTSGSELVIITGRNFGPAGNEKIDRVRYGRSIGGGGTVEDDWLFATGCSVVESHFRIECRTQPGGGKDLRWRVEIDGLNSTSPTTYYAPPTVSSVTDVGQAGPMSSCSTNGGERILLSGTDFGPVSLSGTKSLVDEVTFGPQGRQYAALACKVTVLSTRLECETPPGIGKRLRFYVVIAGQQSMLSTAELTYADPVIENSSTLIIQTDGTLIDLTGTNFGLLVPGIGVRIAFGSTMLLASSTKQSQSTGKDTVAVNVPPLLDASSPMVNIRTILELSSGSTVVTSMPILLSYAPPTIEKIFTYEGESAALRMVLQGKNLCGGTSCGAVEVLSQEGEVVGVSRYVTYSHDRIELEIDVGKGSLRVSVGSSSSAGYQRSSYVTFEHMSPVIDNKASIALQRFATRGNDLLTVEGRYFRMTNVEFWVGEVKGTVVSIAQNADRGPHFYTVTARVPPGQGIDNPLTIRLPSPGGSVLPAESEPAKLSYRPPTSLSMDFHHFPTTGGFVVLEGIDLGLCAHIVVDGVVYGSGGRVPFDSSSSSPSASCNQVTNGVNGHALVKLGLPDGDGTGHTLSISVGGQIASVSTGWKSMLEQCDEGKGIVGKHGWFDYDAPIVISVEPSKEVLTSSGTTLILRGKNFGLGTPTVVLHGRKGHDAIPLSGDDGSAFVPDQCECAISLKSQCLAGFGCTASTCCAPAEDSATAARGCGCFSNECDCCTRVSECLVVNSTHDTIYCTLQPGQGAGLEVVVTAAQQTSSDGVQSVSDSSLFSFAPPLIHSLSQSRSTSQGGSVVTLHGESFGLRGATIEVLGDGMTKLPPAAAADGTSTTVFSPLSSTIGPIPALTQNHTVVTFVVPPGSGVNRRIRLCVGGQCDIHEASMFHYEVPTIESIEQPAACTTRVRTTACGSPTQGGFHVVLRGQNLGTETTTKATVTIGGMQCCTASSYLDGQPVCSQSCECCVRSHDHEEMVISAPVGVGMDVPIVVSYHSYQGWRIEKKLHYDKPYVNFINPQLGNANGGKVQIHGINFGNVFGAGNVSSVFLGGLECTDITWSGTGPTDEAIQCFIGPDTAGPKDVRMTVGGQTSVWNATEWLISTGHRLYFAECPPSYHGRVGEPCFECPFVTDNDGITVLDSRGEKQYMGTCVGGEDEPIAKQGFYRISLHKQCGSDASMPCTNDTQCAALGEFDQKYLYLYEKYFAHLTGIS